MPRGVSLWNFLGDDGPKMEADDMFSLKQVKDIDKMNKIMEQGPDMLADSDDEQDLSKRKYLR